MGNRNLSVMVALEPGFARQLVDAFKSADAGTVFGSIAELRHAYSNASPESLFGAILRLLASHNKWDPDTDRVGGYESPTTEWLLDSLGLRTPEGFARVLDVVRELPHASDGVAFRHNLTTFVSAAAARLSRDIVSDALRQRAETLLESADGWERSIGLAVAAPLLSAFLSERGDDDETVFRWARRLHGAWFDAPFQQVNDAWFAFTLKRSIAKAATALRAPLSRYFAPFLRAPLTEDAHYEPLNTTPVTPFVYLVNPNPNLDTGELPPTPTVNALTAHHLIDLVPNPAAGLVALLDEYGLEELALSPEYEREDIEKVGELFRADENAMERVLNGMMQNEIDPVVSAFVVAPLVDAHPDIARERHREFFRQLWQSFRGYLQGTESSLPYPALRYAVWTGRYSPALSAMVRSELLDKLEALLDAYDETNFSAETLAGIWSLVQSLADFDEIPVTINFRNYHPLVSALGFVGNWLALRNPAKIMSLPASILGAASELQQTLEGDRLARALCGEP
jgi:hypothetical protein